MASTIMRNSIVDDAWLREMMAANPPKVIPGAGGDTFLTGPVRLAFVHVWEKAPKLSTDKNSKLAFQAAVLFPPGSDFTIFINEMTRIHNEAFPQFPYNPNGTNGVICQGGWPGLTIPFKHAGEWANKYDGYTPGGVVLSTSSDFQPKIVDVRNNPIVDQKQIYPGVWALVALNSYVSGKSQPKKGAGFGLGGIMKIGDDTNLAGTGIDAQKVFADVKVRPPATSPQNAFAGGVAPPPPANPVAAFQPTSAPPPAAAPAPAAPDPFAAFFGGR